MSPKESLRHRLERIAADYSRVTELQSSSLPHNQDLPEDERSSSWAWETDSDGSLTWVSPEITHLTGFRPETVTGTPAFHSVLIQAEEAVLQKVLRENKPFQNLRLDALTSDGREMKLSFSAQPQSDDPEVSSGFNGVARVIRSEFLPGSSHNAGNSVGNTAGKQSPPAGTPLVTTASGYCLDETGFNPVSNPLNEPTMKTEVIGSVLRMPVRSGNTHHGVLELDRGAEGTPWSDEEIHLIDNLTRQLASALQDARAYELTLQALEEMKQADQLKSQLLANMSHELRTPLNSIIGFSSVILKGIDGPINETQEQDVQQIHNAGQHLLGLINNVLDLSKIEADKMQLTLSTVNLKTIIQEVVEIANALTKQKPIELVVDIPDDIPLIEADSTRVRQILLNLLSNAVKFTDEGQIAVFVRAMPPGSSEEILIAVADTGIGIALEDQGKLFEPFSQIQGMSSRPGSGTGLGLSICRHLVGLHHGRIWLESKPGEGSTFSFTLPIRQSSQPLATSSGSIPLLVQSNETLSQIRELLPQHSLEPAKLDTLSAASSQKILLAETALEEPALWNCLHALSHSRSLGLPVQFFSLDEHQGVTLPVVRLVPAGLSNQAIRKLESLARQSSHEHPEWVLVGADDANTQDQVNLLRKIDQAEIILYTDARTALNEIRFHSPAVFIFNLFMPQAEGFRIFETIRAEQLLKDSECVLQIPDAPAGHEGRQFLRYIQHLKANNSLPLQDIRKQILLSIEKYS